MVVCCAAASPARLTRVSGLSAARRSLAQARRVGPATPRAQLPSALGAALRRLAGMAAAGPQPWSEPQHFTADRWWSEKTVAVVRWRSSPAAGATQGFIR